MTNGLVTCSRLISDFKFGFELEAIYAGSDRNFNSVRKFIKDHFGPGDYYFKNDDTIVAKYGIPFEWPSPVLGFTPNSLLRLKVFLNNLYQNKINVNSTCGFHTHFSYNGMTDKDAMWILCHVATDDEIRDKFSHFENFQFTHRKHATIWFLDRIKYCFNSGDFESLRRLLTTDKYRVIRLHPQGTLEWRGPRNFLNRSNPDLIDRFIKRIWDIAAWMSQVSCRTSLNSISRSEFDKQIGDSVLFKKERKYSINQDMSLIYPCVKANPWLKNAEISQVNYSLDGNTLIWKKGDWYSGLWQDGIWENGVWRTGTWVNGTWKSGSWLNGIWLNGQWNSGTWQSGTWTDGFWNDGTWKSGTFRNGVWKSGIWHEGIWENGVWLGGYDSSGNYHTEGDSPDCWD